MTADLIKALEEAEEGSRELSDEVLLALGSTLIPPASCNAGVGGCWTPAGKHEYDARPSPTESVDDALALVPEGWQWQVSNRAPKPHAGRAYIHNRELHFIGIGAQTPNPAYRGHETTATTPALALCAAVLRATPTTLGEE